jgi:hypothetical protein
MTHPTHTTESQDALGVWDARAFAASLHFDAAWLRWKPDDRPRANERTRLEAARKRRKPSLEKLLKQAAKAGKSVKGAEVYPDRTVLQFGEPEPVEPDNPWPLDEFRTKETKQ